MHVNPMHFFVTRLCGIVGIAGTGKLDDTLIGVTPVLVLVLVLVLELEAYVCVCTCVLEATVVFEQWKSLMLGHEGCHQCEMAL